MPSLRIRGSDQRARRVSGATARAVTTSARNSLRTSSARPRRTVTLSRPRVSTHSRRKTVRRRRGSRRTIERSGRIIPSTTPGSPAPAPTSTTSAPSGMSSSMTAQFIRCRSHSRPTSRGPISPRVTPASARRSAYRAISGVASPNSARACSGGATLPPAPEAIRHTYLGLFIHSSDMSTSRQKRRGELHPGPVAHQPSTNGSARGKRGGNTRRPPRSYSWGASLVSRETVNRPRGTPPRSGWAPHPRTHSAAQPRRWRRARPSARTATSGRVPSPHPSA